MPCLYAFDMVKTVKARQYILLYGAQKILANGSSLEAEQRAFDGNQELESAPDVQNGDYILEQLEGMSFGDKSVGKKREKKWKKGQATRGANENVVWKKEKYFF